MPSEPELECGICYHGYDLARRCPRLLPCKHRFCESCLRTLIARRPEDPHSGSRITCAFCRNTCSLSGEGLRDNFPVDEDILEHLLAVNALDQNTSEDEDEDEDGPNSETSSRGSEEPSPVTRRAKVWRSLKRFWKKVRGSDQQGCITDRDMRDLALMSCYMI